MPGVPDIGSFMKMYTGNMKYVLKYILDTHIFIFIHIYTTFPLYSTSFMEAGQKIREIMNGTECDYDGMIGYVQRNQSDSMLQFVRTDSTPCEPGHFLHFSNMEDSPKIYSLKNQANFTQLIDILYLWTNFNSSIWIYILISATICAIILVSIVKLFTDISIRKIVNWYIGIFWNYLMLFLDIAPTKISGYQSSIVLWTTICIGTFYAIHIILMSTLSTDLTVPLNVRSIETLFDLLYDPEFNQTQPVILRQLNMYSVLKHSRPGTDERVLFDKIMANGSAGIKEVSLNDLQTALTMVNDLIGDSVDGKIAIVENSGMIAIGLQLAGCPINPKLISNLTTGIDTIRPSPLSLLVSKKTPTGVREYLQHRLSKVSEGALLEGTYRVLVPLVIEEVMHIPQSIDGLVCAEKVQGIYTDQLDLPWQALDIAPYERLIKICLGIVALAALVLLYESMYHYSTTF